ncbi:sel1 repeat family protein [Polynucleobacter sp. MG-Unter2-18]|uniref:SEL1-like repeat protein n=1 Tax=Polynucleobacter sp. MG-Unter2-18 TaxID=2081052 RepID=UPI001BFD54F2|nr:tetratricopeptide repeat protein [Polynucleobacter sp. MG-Unter2-18]QWD95415.1 sel1 repeat family protein [Polynucleobacter sp. MG-Unter2-18]
MEFLIIIALAGIAFYYFKKAKKTPPIQKTTKDFKIGSNYAFGKGSPGIDKLSAEVFTEQAGKGDIEAHAALGNMYGLGIHFQKDVEQSVKHYQIASDAGHATATYELFGCYLEGAGVPKDEQKAIELLKKAAEMGEPSAQAVMGIFISGGVHGFTQDQTEALHWFMKAAQGGSAHGQLRLADAYIAGELIQPNYEKAFEYYKKAADQDMLAACERLGIFYQTDAYNEKNAAEAFKWNMKGATLGSPKCAYFAGAALLFGDGVELNYEHARTVLEVAAESDYADAQYLYGMMLDRALGGDRDQLKAIEWLGKSADQGNEKALAELHQMREDIDRSLDGITGISR